MAFPELRVVLDGNASIRKYYKQDWNSLNAISPKFKQIYFSYISYSKESVFAGNFIALFYRLTGLLGTVFANGPGDLGSISDRVIPKTLKMTLDTSLLNTQ